MQKERTKSPSLWTIYLYVATLASFRSVCSWSRIWSLDFCFGTGKRLLNSLHSHWSRPSDYGLHLPLASPASYPQPHSTAPSQISRATATHAERLERGVDSQTIVQTCPVALLRLVLEWMSFSLVAWPAHASCSGWQWTLRIAAPSCSHLSEQPAPSPWAAGQFTFLVPHFCWGLPKAQSLPSNRGQPEDAGLF